MSYITVSRIGSVELVINKSRFIGQCFPCDTEERALSLLNEVRRDNRTANHNCFAYKIGSEGGPARFSDDGEPQGTAGMPIMETIKHKDCTNLMVVVTRYFGGVLLGAGGLVRAYTKSATAAIDAARLVKMQECVLYSLSMDYSSFSALESFLRGFGELRDLEYTQNVSLGLAIPSDKAQDFIKAVVERSDGRLKPEKKDEIFEAVEL